ncbi:hypothetical protein, partial [Helicobacter sp. MIT 05-5294]|uniref:hypothetical protein n=1 Tax=Helicobacter sp. MIT 05-5294 TaxID=1548150 RepID=UPI001EE8B012
IIVKEHLLFHSKIFLAQKRKWNFSKVSLRGVERFKYFFKNVNIYNFIDISNFYLLIIILF